MLKALAPLEPDTAKTFAPLMTAPPQQGLAASCKGTSGLDVAAAAGAVQAQRGVELGVGAARFAIDSLAGLIDMATNPLDTVRGIETMAAHSATLPWWARKGCGLGADMIGMLDGDTSATDLLHNLTKDPITQKLDDNTYWRGAAEGMVAPIAEPLSKGRYWEASGYAMAGLASLLLGEEATLGKLAKATRGTRTFESAGANTARPLPKMDNSLNVPMAGSKAESSTIKAWRAADDAGTELSDGVRRGEGVPEIDNRVLKIADEVQGGPFTGDGNQVPAFTSPPRFTQQRVVASIRRAQANLAADPRLPPLDADAMMAGVRVQGEIAHVTRLAEDLCRRNPKLCWDAAVMQARKLAPQLPMYMGRGVESYIPGTRVGPNAPRVLHVYDQMDTGMLDEVAHHEAVHTMAHPTFNNQKLLPFNEGVTQWLTKQTCPSCEAYAEHVKIIDEVAVQVGDDNLIEVFTRSGQVDMRHLLEGVQTNHCPDVLRRLQEAHDGPAGGSTVPNP